MNLPLLPEIVKYLNCDVKLIPLSFKYAPCKTPKLQWAPWVLLSPSVTQFRAQSALNIWQHWTLYIYIKLVTHTFKRVFIQLAGMRCPTAKAFILSRQNSACVDHAYPGKRMKCNHMKERNRLWYMNCRLPGAGNSLSSETKPPQLHRFVSWMSLLYFQTHSVFKAFRKKKTVPQA